jgi:hypothetical protein
MPVTVRRTRALQIVGGAAAWLLAGLIVLGFGFDGGCGRDRGLLVGGDTPYARCLAASPPAEGTRRIGPLALTIKDRALEIRGLSKGARLAAFAGPGFGHPPAAQDLAAIRATRADLSLVLGDLGDTQAIADATALSLAGLGHPVLVLAGGRDTRERITKALESLGSRSANLVDISALRTIHIENDTFFPVAGALDGGDALAEDSCGYAEADLRELAGGARNQKGRKWLLAWQAPARRAGSGPACLACTEHGIDLGSGALAHLAEAVGASGGLYAWPHVQAMRPIRGATPAQTTAPGATAITGVIVPRVVGPALERSDGSHVPAGFALLRLGPDGVMSLEAGE